MWMRIYMCITTKLIDIWTWLTFYRRGARPWESGAKPCPKGPGGPFVKGDSLTTTSSSPPVIPILTINLEDKQFSLVSPRINDKANACRTQILPRRAVQRSVPWAVNGGTKWCQRTYFTRAWIYLSSPKAPNICSPNKYHRNHNESEGCFKGAFCVICFFWSYFHQVTWDIHRSR